MRKRDWREIINQLYNSFPEGESEPLIGITANYGDGMEKLAEGYYKKVVLAGGAPIVIPPLQDVNAIVSTLDKIDGLILTGGGDYNPLLCDEEPSPLLHSINSERDVPELLLTTLAFNRHLPILGICRGIQTIAIASDGQVAQDISHVSTHPIKHSQDAPRSEPTHTVNIHKDSILYSIFKEEVIDVNSFHHQVVCHEGNKFVPTASSPDGAIEAIESDEMCPIVGVQWHPECLEGDELFRWIVHEADLYRKARRLQRRILTLDTHCDTPLLFAQGARIDRRETQALVDLHKMKEGGVDAVIMAAYLPQPKEGESFVSLVDYQVKGPRDYADLIFNKIEDMVSANQQYVGIARCPSELWANKQAGKASIMMGIENGLALEGDISNVEHFAKRGVVYMTLCHNGDNDICDSARGTDTHHGVSDFGKSVIREMNRLGMMVDLSHASEKTFWDTLELSSKPVVCSHSSSRALCDHPRNLTDEQMRALAEKGGVCQITAFGGFLRLDGKASLNDLIAHIMHAIDIMGVDHVGIGTDFDGDGGVRGMADASYFISLTKMLMLEGLDEQQIGGILGGNFMRVMKEIQDVE